MSDAGPAKVDITEVATRAARLASDLEASGISPDTLARRGSDILATLREAAEALAQYELDAMILEAKDEQIARQSELLEAIGYPMLQVRRDILCVPVVGPFDLERASRMMDVTLRGAVEKSARDVIIDLTGARVEDPSVGACLSDVTRALALVGVRVHLSGIGANLATSLVESAGALAHVTTYSTLSAALSAISNDGERR